jgi:regulator of sigma E protease
MYIVTAILVFGGLIFFHELGHFLAARRNGILVHEFAIGFGPKIASWKRGDTLYSLRLFAFLGGFVRMAGMDPSEDEPAEGEPGDEAEPMARPVVSDGQKFRFKTAGQRAAVLAAGPFANLVLAVAVLALVFGPIGMSFAHSDAPVIGQTQGGMPAEAAGLRPGDRIVAVEGVEVATWNEMTTLIRARLGEETRLVVERKGRELLVDVVPAPHTEDASIGMIGIIPETIKLHLPWYEAIWASIRHVGGMIVALLAAFGNLFVGKGAGEVAGPIGIVGMVQQAQAMGIERVLELAGALSVTLAIFNLLPLPALDGGRLLFIGIERLRGRPVDPQRENFIHFIGFALLLLLSVAIAFRDIQRLIV